jgi:hypothetical protein
MPNSNLSNVTFTDQDIADALQILHAFTAKLPFLISMTVSERKKCMKLGDKSIGFVEKSINYAETNPGMVPPFVDVVAFKREFKLSRDIHDIMREVNPLLQNLEDTATKAGSEALATSIVFYNSVKAAAKQNVPGAKAIYDDLQKRFPGPGAVPTTTVPPSV